ncbi:EamA family transporter RarD [Haemophilus parahaemolyticus]|uniref:EamA family transporter RarD n=2 Tax=Haemophilus parahaemolyticus TaxID=735 RepID=A0AAE6JQN4_HAEPH|nr:EamA family transporter RarD [Haemophilus parahaemolyticus]EIJ69607.1 protein RarD [Haemophilus parahaemolyticus HK385]OOR96929.1 EamA family transporter [Haemophilus parahaemolyticus]QEN10416.1 EamA family transporter RarD [Haemophilus parahaemolyticus]QRP13404.1 EamA family transporter RarD [Haemophilus parahaemolyticus]STO65719.1 DMT superfamily drug/metabolite transporter [Haemophilus parahaemolyticus HK385]
MLKGVLFSLTASFLFGCLYYLAIHLKPLAGESIFGIRMVLTLPCLFLALLLFKKWDEFSLFLQRLKREPKLFLLILTTSTIVGGQMWLFLWAPNSGKAIEVSIGYLLMPIVMVAFGKIVYKEPLSRNKWLAIIFAFIGVVSNIMLAGKLSLESVFVCTGYPIYFYLRRKFGLSHLHSFVFEIAFLIPVAIYFISKTDIQTVQQVNPHIYIFIALLGIISGAALISYTLASTILPFNLLGLLGYVEPCVMLLISFLIGEKLNPDAYILMSCLLIAVLLLILDGIQAVRCSHRKYKAQMKVK